MRSPLNHLSASVVIVKTNEFLCKTVLWAGSWNPWPRSHKLTPLVNREAQYASHWQTELRTAILALLLGYRCVGGLLAFSPCDDHIFSTADSSTKGTKSRNEQEFWFWRPSPELVYEVEMTWVVLYEIKTATIHTNWQTRCWPMTSSNATTIRMPTVSRRHIFS